MAKSTIILSLLVSLLALGTGVSLWYITAPPILRLEPHLAQLPFGLPIPTTAAFHYDVTSGSAAIWNPDERQLEYEQNAFERRPIASLTKLMTAMVALDKGLMWEQSTTIIPEEYGLGGNLILAPGETVTMRDLFHASLLGSANNATKAYVRQLPGDPTEFVQAMNRKAIELGLEQTHFEDVTGLKPGNVSTAYEVAIMAQHAFQHYPAIAQATRHGGYAFIIGGSGREHTIQNTNKLIADEGMALGASKTGYLDEAHYCLVIQGHENDHRIIVLLGSPSEEHNLADAKALLQREVSSD